MGLRPTNRFENNLNGMGKKADEKIRKSLLKKSSNDRMFFDNLLLLIWCECRRPIAERREEEREWWKDVELCCYSSARRGGMARNDALDVGDDIYVNTALRKLNRRELAAVQEFIDTHEWQTVAEAKMQIAADLLNDCCATALNVI